ncbi:AraC family transcriptional regulator [Kribbella sp. NPDC050124]|uniref:AraC family transcriptional regulator n=1 Tax=Kribbella sp. NPDC050124 TaxID=3364114 RepID=UPI003791DE95
MTSSIVSLGDFRPAVADYPPGSTYGPRVVPSYELMWLLSGSVTWVWHTDKAGGRRELELVPGMLLLTRPGMRDEYRWDERRPTRHGYVHFDIDPAPVLPPLVRPVAEPGPLAGLLQYLLWLADEPDPTWACRAADVLALIMRLFIDGPLPADDGPAEPPALAAALDHVRTQWADQLRPFTLAELAAAAGTSRAHLARLFGKQFGTGMITALELVRLARAESLLSRSNLTITQIAHACGFSDPLHFSRRFRATYGTPPRTFRHTATLESPLTTTNLHRLARRLDATTAGGIVQMSSTPVVGSGT